MEGVMTAPEEADEEDVRDWLEEGITRGDLVIPLLASLGVRTTVAPEPRPRPRPKEAEEEVELVGVWARRIGPLPYVGTVA
jgi:hypothetical protein